MNRKLIIQDGKINFSCHRECCEHSCCGPFAGIASTIESIDNRPFEEIVLTNEDYLELYKHGRSDLIEEGYSKETGKKYYKMALEPDGTCKAFKDGKCSIHGFNPTLCKAFPFYFDMFSGLCAICCEGFSEAYWTDFDEYSPYIEAARKMYEYWFDFYSGKKENT